MLSPTTVKAASLPAVCVGAATDDWIGIFEPPRPLAVGKKETVDAAEQNDNHVLQHIANLPGASTQTQVATTGYTLAGPTTPYLWALRAWRRASTPRLLAWNGDQPEYHWFAWWIYSRGADEEMKRRVDRLLLRQ